MPEGCRDHGTPVWDPDTVERLIARLDSVERERDLAQSRERNIALDYAELDKLYAEAQRKLEAAEGALGKCFDVLVIGPAGPSKPESFRYPWAWSSTSGRGPLAG